MLLPSTLFLCQCWGWFIQLVFQMNLYACSISGTFTTSLLSRLIDAKGRAGISVEFVKTTKQRSDTIIFPIRSATMRERPAREEICLYRHIWCTTLLLDITVI